MGVDNGLHRETIMRQFVQSVWWLFVHLAGREENEHHYYCFVIQLLQAKYTWIDVQNKLTTAAHSVNRITGTNEITNNGYFAQDSNCIRPRSKLMLQCSNGPKTRKRKCTKCLNTKGKCCPTSTGTHIEIVKVSPSVFAISLPNVVLSNRIE